MSEQIGDYIEPLGDNLGTNGEPFGESCCGDVGNTNGIGTIRVIIHIAWGRFCPPSLRWTPLRRRLGARSPPPGGRKGYCFLLTGTRKTKLFESQMLVFVDRYKENEAFRHP